MPWADGFVLCGDQHLRRFICPAVWWHGTAFLQLFRVIGTVAFLGYGAAHVQESSSIDPGELAVDVTPRKQCIARVFRPAWRTC